MVGFAYGSHKVSVARQSVTVAGSYYYGVDGSGAAYASNSVQVSDFNAEGEKFWQTRYDLTWPRMVFWV
ncbi:OprD family outer membrane porin [Pseudomonas putida]|uniref:OprD family outer membrane porin n=1 Tax=Pseudomonas putida TaxID=303 RepID=UPI0039E0006A